MRLPDAAPMCWSYHANKCMHLRLVGSGEEMSSAVSFHPEYAHVFFGDDERIEGYHKPCLELFFNAVTFKSLVVFSSAEKKALVPCTPVVDNVVHYLAPGSWTTNRDRFIEELERDRASFRPMGDSVTEYVLEKRNGGAECDESHDPHSLPGDEVTYKVFWSKFYDDQNDRYHEDFLRWHENLQIFVLLEIDGGTYIEARDPRWEFYGLFEHRRRASGEESYRCVGYCTAYRFYSLKHSFRLRISQFLLLPPYQKRGHGRRLLSAIYEHAKARGVRDIPVEDPAPEFMRLRDMVDMKLLLEDKAFSPDMKEISSELVDHIVKAHRLWKKQIRRCFEIYRLRHTNRSDEEEYREYRLYVKRRLIHENREHLEAFEAGDDRKKELHRLYTVLEAQYSALLEKLALQGL